eukprot:TRINITY_DN5732_c0_g1_i2.p1 TRINITY_DN5732_c0_g1~~TRINITY_DN5732_c0_g1_i2.p1  ORF type:complete len:486 (-),score=132.00 TRINITY_DN5732_c0_g1_i2:291-1694(-)
MTRSHPLPILCGPLLLVLLLLPCAPLVSAHPFGPYGYIPPRAIHLALTGDPTEMVVSWQTSIPTNESVVKVFKAASDADPSSSAPLLVASFSGNQSTYLLSAGIFHNVKVTGLEPSSTYEYSCGSASGWTPNFSFKTAAKPALANATHPASRFIMYGDMGITGSAQTVRAVSDRVASDDIHFIYHAGDYGYGDDRAAVFYEMSWDVFFDHMQEVMPFIPYMAAVGNHETQCGSDDCEYYASNCTVFNTRFRMPSAESGGAENMWFSWDYHNIHFVSISTETDYPNAPKQGPGYHFGDQLSWLEADLKKADENNLVDWIIVVGHRPMYTSFNGDGTGERDGVPIDSGADMQAAFEELFHNYHVDLYMDGHIHAYERNYPIYNNTVCGSFTREEYFRPACTAYVIAGAAGNTEGHYRTDWDPNPPAWSAFIYDKDFGYAVVSVSGYSELLWEWRRATDDKVMDTFKIVK